MVPYRYIRISDEFMDELLGSVRGEESAVLVGHRFSGKNYLLRELETRLKACGTPAVLSVSLFKETGIWNEEGAFEVFRAAAGEPKGGDARASGGDFISPVDRFSNAAGGPVVLLAGNVDAMGHPLARKLLQALRVRVEDKRLIAVVTGESDLSELVHGPSSEFNCANQYLIQGFDRPKFDELIRGFARARSIEFECEGEAVKVLWELSGGDYGVADAVLATLARLRVISFDWKTRPVTAGDLQRAASALAHPGQGRADLLRRAAEIVAWDPASLKPLERLLSNGSVELSVLDAAPGPLELAGIAVQQERCLRFASPFMEQYARAYYTERRLGDLYGRSGDWDTAFARWANSDRNLLLRPTDVEDRAEAAATLRALCAMLYSRAGREPDLLNDLFAKGCRYVLGFEEVTFWRRTRAWEACPGVGLPMSEALANRFKAVLPATESPSRGLFPLPEPWGRFGIAAVLDALPPDDAAAVVVSDAASQRVVSRERLRMAEELLSHFVEAQRSALRAERNRQRLAIRNRHVDLVDTIIDSLGSRVLDVGHALALAAKGLRDIGYRRAFFCLVDPTRQRVQGVLNSSDDSFDEIVGLTRWPLAEPMADLQPYVVCTSEAKIVPDASQEPLANKEVVKRAGMGALAVVPMTDRTGQVIGTIHVERSDHRVPSEEEVEDLKLLGRQLGTLIQQSERVNFLQSTIEKSPDPVVIVDTSERLRYANPAAADLFSLPTGWREYGDRPFVTTYPVHAILDVIREALKGHRQVRAVSGLADDPEYRGTVVCDVIQNWQHQPVGALIHVDNQDYLYRVFEAFRIVAASQDTASALRAMLDAARELGHATGRLYLVYEENPDFLVSTLSFGIQDETLATNFDAGKFRLPRQAGCWRCIDERRPLVFCWAEDDSSPPIIQTDLGLDLNAVGRPPYAEELGKKPGVPWLDIPLGTQGKVTLPLLPGLLPENLRLLEVLSDNVAKLLTAFRKRDQLVREHDQMILRSAAERAVSMTAHNIATRLATLPTLLGRYRLIETGNERLRALNDDFSHVIDETSVIIRRAKELLAAAAPRISSVALEELARGVLTSNLASEQWALEARQPDLIIETDRHLLETCLVHFIENSKNVVPDDKALRITMSLEPEGTDWVRITYRDNGPGIRPEHKRRIFESFFSYSPQQKGKGLGLGLRFVRHVVETHGGRVWEEGTFGKGAVFVIRMPRAASVTERR